MPEQSSPTIRRKASILAIRSKHFEIYNDKQKSIEKRNKSAKMYNLVSVAGEILANLTLLTTLQFNTLNKITKMRVCMPKLQKISEKTQN